MNRIPKSHVSVVGVSGLVEYLNKMFVTKRDILEILLNLPVNPVTINCLLTPLFTQWKERKLHTSSAVVVMKESH